MECKSDHIAIKNIPTKRLDLQYREMQIAKLVENVMRNNKKERITLLLGLPGMGKTSITINALHYMIERKFFTRGVVLVNLLNIRDLNNMMKQMQNFMLKSLELTR